MWLAILDAGIASTGRLRSRAELEMILDYSEAQLVIRQIEATSQKELQRNVYETAYRYATHRSEWALASLKGRTALDEARTRAHNAFIEARNSLSRAMSKAGEDNEWRRVLGSDRRRIGDLACYIGLHLGIRSR